MDDYRTIIENAELGSVVPIIKEVEMGCPVEFFAKLSDYGRLQHCVLLESKEYLKDSGALTFGTSKPSLYLTGTGEEFTIKALTRVGRRIINYLSTVGRDRFSFASEINFSSSEITGRIKLSGEEAVDENSRLNCVSQMDVIRAVGFAFELGSQPFQVTCGLLGAISYDFIDQFEKLPANSSDILENPDYELYFADNIFIVDHSQNKGYIVVNVIVTDDDREQMVREAKDCFDYYYNMVRFNQPKPQGRVGLGVEPGSDTPKFEYEDMVQKAKQNIVDGDVFQAVVSRTFIEPCNDEPLEIYRRLRKLNPSPYMFYMNTPNTILMGSSPELNLRVKGDQKKYVEIRPIAGTKPRGRINDEIDPETDMRYEAELKLDRKELAEHMMLVDLARNDIARVAEPGTRVVTEMLTVEKYNSVMHLVSNVRGQLREGLDALSAYLATMNMGTLTGAPKIEAMKILRQLEKNKRGYYGGAMMYLTVDGQFDSCITIRSLQIKGNAAYVRAGAGIVHDSIPESEYMETQHKAASCIKAIRGE